MPRIFFVVFFVGTTTLAKLEHCPITVHSLYHHLFFMAKNITTDKVSYIKDMLVEERQSLTDVMDSIKREELLSENINDTFEENSSMADKIADSIAAFGGSWRFIISFLSFLFLWMLVNTVLVLTNHFDPYPFILLNLILSTIAALQ